MEFFYKLLKFIRIFFKLNLTIFIQKVSKESAKETCHNRNKSFETKSSFINFSFRFPKDSKR